MSSAFQVSRRSTSSVASSSRFLNLMDGPTPFLYTTRNPAVRGKHSSTTHKTHREQHSNTAAQRMLFFFLRSRTDVTRPKLMMPLFVVGDGTACIASARVTSRQDVRVHGIIRECHAWCACMRVFFWGGLGKRGEGSEGICLKHERDLETRATIFITPLLTSRLEFFGVLVDEIAYVRVVAEFSFADLQARLVECGGHLVGVLGATPLALGRYGVVLGEVAETLAIGTTIETCKPESDAIGVVITRSSTRGSTGGVITRRCGVRSPRRRRRREEKDEANDAAHPPFHPHLYDRG